MMEYDKQTHYKCSVCKRIIAIKELQKHCLSCAKNFGIKCKNCSRRVANENYAQHYNLCVKLYNNNNNKHIDNNHLLMPNNKTLNLLTHNENLFMGYNFSEIENEATRLVHSENKPSKDHLRKHGSINDFEIIETIDDFTNSIQLIP